MTTRAHEQGFTLPELLVTAGAVFVILVLLFVFVHPRDYTIQDRNAERWLAISQLTQALTQYKAKYGKLPDGITDTAKTISNSGDTSIDLCSALVPEILTDLPVDPKQGLQLPTGACIGSQDDPTAYAYVSQYTIRRAKNDTVTIAAPFAENHAKISISHTY